MLLSLKDSPIFYIKKSKYKCRPSRRNIGDIKLDMSSCRTAFQIFEKPFSLANYLLPSGRHF